MIGLSYVFYGWVGWSYCLLLLSTTVVAFTGGAVVDAMRSERARRIAMGVAVAALLGILGWFKYYGFVSVNLDNLTHALGMGRAVPLIQVALPIAISFFTFMAISYVVDVYRRVLPPARLLDFAVVPLLLPPPAGRPYRARHRVVATDPAQARPRERRLLAGVLAHSGRAVQEGRDLLVRLDCDRAACLHVAPAALGARGDLRRLGVRRADLLRLQRLHRHRHRPGAAARHPVPPELRCPLHRPEPPGLLAALAHDPVALAA